MGEKRRWPGNSGPASGSQQEGWDAPDLGCHAATAWLHEGLDRCASQFECTGGGGWWESLGRYCETTDFLDQMKVWKFENPWKDENGQKALDHAEGTLNSKAGACAVMLVHREELSFGLWLFGRSWRCSGKPWERHHKSGAFQCTDATHGVKQPVGLDPALSHGHWKRTHAAKCSTSWWNWALNCDGNVGLEIGSVEIDLDS